MAMSRFSIVSITIVIISASVEHDSEYRFVVLQVLSSLHVPICTNSGFDFPFLSIGLDSGLQKLPFF